MRKDIWVSLVGGAGLILVTKNEYVYESFSEDEDSDVAPKAVKTAADPVNAKGQCRWTEESDVFLWEKVI
jgi:hypothetical protein